MSSTEKVSSTNQFEIAYRAWAENKFGTKFISSSAYSKQLAAILKEYFRTYLDQHMMMALLDGRIAEERNALRRSRGKASRPETRTGHAQKLSQLLLLRKIIQTSPTQFTTEDVMRYMELADGIVAEVSEDLGVREVLAAATVGLTLTSANGKEILKNLQRPPTAHLQTTPMPKPYAYLSQNYNAIPEAKRVIFLTFDAHEGSPAAVAGSLEYLKLFHEYEVPVTLFFTSTFILKHPEIALRACQDGHPIGSHLMTHEGPAVWPTRFNKTWSKETFLEELLSVDEALKSVTDGKCGAAKIFRMPFGLTDPRYTRTQQQEAIQWATEAGYTHIGWTIDSMDWYSRAQHEYDVSLGQKSLYKDKRQMLAEIASALLRGDAGPIFLAHMLKYRSPSEDGPIDMFPELLYMIQKRGYRAGLITEFLAKDFKPMTNEVLVTAAKESVP